MWLVCRSWTLQLSTTFYCGQKLQMSHQTLLLAVHYLQAFIRDAEDWGDQGKHTRTYVRSTCWTNLNFTAVAVHTVIDIWTGSSLPFAPFFDTQMSNQFFQLHFHWYRNRRWGVKDITSTLLQLVACELPHYQLYLGLFGSARMHEAYRLQRFRELTRKVEVIDLLN